MTTYRVRFFKNVTTCDRHTIEVEADSPEEARAKVLEWGSGDDSQLTDEELATENLEKEGEVVDSVFSELEEADHPSAVVEIEPDPLPKWDVFAARDGETYRSTVEAEDEDHAKQIARPFINSDFRMGFTNEQIAEDSDFFDGELDGFLVEGKS